MYLIQYMKLFSLLVEDADFFICMDFDMAESKGNIEI